MAMSRIILLGTGLNRKRIHFCKIHVNKKSIVSILYVMHARMEFIIDEQLSITLGNLCTCLYIFHMYLIRSLETKERYVFNFHVRIHIQKEFIITRCPSGHKLHRSNVM